MKLRALTYKDNHNHDGEPVLQNYPSRLEAEIDTLRAQVDHMRAYIADLEKTADMDPLMPVYNRRAFMRELARAQSMSDRFNIPASVVFIDLNDFKSINDRYGHSIGDDMLREVGKALLNGVRAADTVARLGGDEFGVLLLKTDPNFAEVKAETLCRHISDIVIDIPTGGVKITAAWGIAPCSIDSDVETILSRADKNMYSAKRQSVHRP